MDDESYDNGKDDYELPESHPFGGEYGEVKCMAYNHMLGHPRKEPSMEEIMYILGNSHEEFTVQQGLRELQHDGIVKTTVLPKAYQEDDLPSTFYTFTDQHERNPDPLRGADPAGVEAIWQVLHQKTEKTDRIKQLEQAPRPEDYLP